MNILIEKYMHFSIKIDSFERGDFWSGAVDEGKQKNLTKVHFYML